MAYNQAWLNRLNDSRNNFYSEPSSFTGSIFKAAVTVVIIGAGIKAASSMHSYLRKKKRVQISLSKPDIVILHQFPRAVTVPNISPFPIKLESYLRLAKIPYENDFGDPLGPKGKCPYITLNGEDIADSQIIIEHLNKVYNVDLDKDLTETEKSIGHAFRILAENHLYWAIVLYRYDYDRCNGVKKVMQGASILKFVLVNFVPMRIKRAAFMHGMGRHNQTQVHQMAQKDLTRLARFLGDKKFLFGDQITESDCALFGILAQIMWTLPGTALEEFFLSECSNLKNYCLRMKEQIWPDWDQCLYPKK